MSNLKNNILAIAKKGLTPFKYESADLKTPIFVKNMTIGEQEVYWKILEATKKSGNKMNATAFAQVVCDEAGELVFSENDVDEINKLPSKIVLGVVNFFVDKNGLNKSAKNAADDAEKN